MSKLRGLYAITDGSSGEELFNKARQAIDGGAAVLQYRDKSANPEKRLQEARTLQDICSASGIPLIINDDAELAAQVGAAGVHLGKEDEHMLRARELLGDQAIIGISCYNRFELAEEAISLGADYVAFGSFFPSGTKPLAVPASIELLHRAKAQLSLPVVAIGGITPENGPSLIEAGADMLAVIQAIFAQPDITAAANTFAALFEE